MLLQCAVLLQALRAAAGDADHPYDGEDADAETRRAAGPMPEDPADPARCDVENDPAVSVSTVERAFAFYRLTALPLAHTDGTIGRYHEADITSGTIIPSRTPTSPTWTTPSSARSRL